MAPDADAGAVLRAPRAWHRAPGQCALLHEKRSGTFTCVGCGQPLFVADRKFESGTGWPSFFAPIAGAIETSSDRTHFMVRTEAHCSRCGGHLGHVFPDGPPPTGDRYCINGVALHFSPDAGRRWSALAGTATGVNFRLPASAKGGPRSLAKVEAEPRFHLAHSPIRKLHSALALGISDGPP